ncbi:hypothetical protein GF322_03445 [Candidatus Dependentiae bacterium]|nr:hypothetical protein [Candidatus Dependentiae bacterium]
MKKILVFTSFVGCCSIFAANVKVDKSQLKNVDKPQLKKDAVQSGLEVKKREKKTFSTQNKPSTNKTRPKLISIDSILLMQKSKEGQLLTQKLQKDIEEFQNFAKNAQQEVADFQETVQKQAKVLSKEALMEKGERLEKMKKNAERELADREAELKRKIQREQMSLREKQLANVSKIFENKNWGLVIDRNTPGILFVKDSIDKTDELLKSIDEEYEKTTAKKIVENEKDNNLISASKKAA